MLPQDPTPSPRSVDIVIPGSEIPVFFKTKSLGSSVSIQLDTNKMLRGIAFCVCYGANYSSDDEFSCGVLFRDINGQFNYMKKIVAQKIYRRSSNLLWLSYSPRAFYSECLQSTFYLEFMFFDKEFSNNSCCGPCGVWMIYEEDMQVLNLVLETATNLLKMERMNINAHVPRGKIYFLVYFKFQYAST